MVGLKVALKMESMGELKRTRGCHEVERAGMMEIMEVGALCGRSVEVHVVNVGVLTVLPASW